MSHDYFTSAAAARTLGVGVTAIKRWADNGVLACVTTAGGHRRFRRADVERLRHPSREATSDPWGPWLDALIHHADINAVLALAFGERSARGAWHHVADHLGGLLVAIGERWAEGQLTVAQEHIASAGLQRALGVVTETMPVAREAPRCILAPAEGDEHTLGLSLAELCLRERGWRAEWLGSPARASDVCERVREGAQMVALSASMAMKSRGPLRKQVRLVGAACQRAGIPLILGGTGRWPDPPPFGVRLNGWSEFHAALRARH